MKKQSETEYIVEKILDKKKFKNEVKYLVKWMGYAESKSTWEPVSHLMKCMDLVEEFEKSQNKPSDKKQPKTEDKKLIGKKRRNSSEEKEEEKSSETFSNEKEVELDRENLLKSPTKYATKSSRLSEKINSIKSISSSSPEHMTKDIPSIKSPEKLNHMQSVNDILRDNVVLTSPKILTRTMLKKSEDDKIIENVYEK
jgi:hypothetical protein